YTDHADALYSCLEDGTDIRKECDFTDITGEPYSPSAHVICDNTCLYFSVRQTDEDGYRSEQCYRYNVITKKTDNLTEMAGEKFGIDCPYIYLQDVFNDNIYFRLYECEYGEPTKVNTRFEHGKFVYDLMYDPIQTYIDCYVASFNFDDVAAISGEELYNASVLFTVKTPDSVILEKYKGNKKSALISVGNDTFEVKTLAEYPSNWTVIYIMDDCFYYVIEGNADMAGYTVDAQMPYTSIKMENPIGGRVYRYDFETKKSVCVLNNPEYFNFRLIYLDGEKFAALTDMVIDGVTNRTFYFLFGEVNEKGNLVNIEEVHHSVYTHDSFTIGGPVFLED
ncbi:MAG: hypothetical protein KBS59_06955, partial [Clostridiales bacterium]|nr:hypothetical protein [Clostridiales bacterium]